MKKTNVITKIAGIALAALAVVAVGTGSASATSRREEFGKMWKKNYLK